ncbi:MAG: uracil phosphoribosyltransferase [Flavobacteriales bacterium]
MLHNFQLTHTLFNRFMVELRDMEIQKDSMRFRRNLERMGEIMAYEISKTLPYSNIIVTTPLGEAECSVHSEEPVIATILRAGLPMHYGLMNYFDKADTAFAAAYRKHDTDDTFTISVDYVSSANLDGRILILADPMLATGNSLVAVYKRLLAFGTPASIHIVSAIASKTGLSHVKSRMPEHTHYWMGAIDDELTAQSYIVPGLGDAGDLAFGNKE